MHNVKGHNERAATGKPQSRSFSSASYLEGLMAELDRAAICTRIHEARVQASLTQEEAADALHVHRRTIQNWESPKLGIVAWDRLDEIAKLYGVTREWLLHGDVEPTDEAVRQAIREELEPLVEALRRVEARLEGAEHPPADDGPA